MSEQTQNPIERLSRALVGSVKAPSLSADHQRERGAELVRYLTTGGIALGGGISAAVAMANRLKSLREEQELEDESILNDETLYIPAPVTKKAGEAKGPHPLVAPGLAMSGALLGGVSTYAIAQSIWNMVERKRRQALVDEAQNEALLVSDIEAEKNASTAPPTAKMNWADVLTGLPVAIPLTSAAVSAALAYAALNKSFPTVKKTKDPRPKRVRLVAPDGAITPIGKDRDDALEVETEDLDKSASQRDLEDAAYAFLVALTKEAGCELTADLVALTAEHGIDAMEKMADDLGAAALVELSKGASARSNPSGHELTLICETLCKSATLAPTVRTIAAAEMANAIPFFFKMAASYSDGLRNGLCDIGGYLGVERRMAAGPALSGDLEKSASAGAPSGLLALLQRLFGGGGAQPAAPVTHHQNEERDAALTSDVSGGMAGEAEEGAARTDDQESQGKDDVVDLAMAGAIT